MIVNNTKKGIYVHIPFCLKKCNYCDFYSLPSYNCVGDYVDALCMNIDCVAKDNDMIEIDSIFVGGGTPSSIDGEYIQQILSKIKSSFRVSDDCEISIEANPATVDEEKLKKYFNSGINRISFGFQSSNDIELKTLGRLHSAMDFKSSVDMARNVGFGNINADIMLGIPHQTKESLLKTLDFVCDAGVEHISAYMLKIEEGTPFYRDLDKLPLPLEDEVCDMYLLLVEYLKNAGYNQYEISNFSKLGFDCRHNLKYWQGDEYIGVGTAAHSYLNNERYSYPRNVSEYISCKDFRSLKTDSFLIDDEEKKREKIIFGLRLCGGIELDLLKGYNVKDILRLYENAGYCSLSSDRLKLTPKGMLVSNQIISEILLRERDI